MRRLNENDQSAAKRAEDAFNEIIDWDLKRKFPPTRRTAPNSPLFHYTTAEGLKGIIENNELWASSAYFLNDSSEISHGYSLLAEVLDAWLTDNEPSEESLSARVARDFRQSFGQNRLKIEEFEPVFLACFCEEDDLLSQWRNYGQAGGYSIAFGAAPNASSGFNPEATTYTSEWVKVNYDRDAQIMESRSVVNSLFETIDERVTTRDIDLIDPHPLFGYNEFRKIIADILMEEIAGFKNKAFQSEKEWRIVVRARDLTKQNKDDGGKTLPALHFRISNDTLVPYVKLRPSDKAKRLPIEQIRSGPTLEKARTGMVVSMMLRKHGFGNVKIEGSDIPVRKP